MKQSEPMEAMYSVQFIAALLHVSVPQARKLFRGRTGIVVLGGPGRPTWRIPRSLLLKVLAEHGYAPERLDWEGVPS